MKSVFFSIANALFGSAAAALLPVERLPEPSRRRNWIPASASRYTSHQGEGEKARRREQLARRGGAA